MPINALPVELSPKNQAPARVWLACLTFAAVWLAGPEASARRPPRRPALLCRGYDHPAVWSACRLRALGGVVLIGGLVVAGLSPAFAYGDHTRCEAGACVHTPNTFTRQVAIGLAATGGGAIMAGSIVLVMGQLRMNDARRRAELERFSLAPGPSGSVGGGLQWRF